VARFAVVNIVSALVTLAGQRLRTGDHAKSQRRKMIWLTSSCALAILREKGLSLALQRFCVRTVPFLILRFGVSA
jgi:hypothetical protein